MKKHVLILLMVMLWASAAAAQQAAEPKGPAPRAEVFEGLIGPSYHWVSQEGNARADEYDFLKSTVGGDLRFVLDRHALCLPEGLHRRDGLRLPGRRAREFSHPGRVP